MKGAVTKLQHAFQGHGEAKSSEVEKPGPDPAVQAEREVLGEAPEVGNIPVHVTEEKVELGEQIVRNTVGEQGRGPNEHGGDLAMGEAKGSEKADLGEEGAGDAGDEEEGGVGGEGAEAELAEEVEGGAELVGDAGDKEPGAAGEGEVDVGEGDRHLVEEEVHQRVQLRVGLQGQQDRVAVQDAAQGPASQAQGGERLGRPLHARDRGRPEARV
ncbi:hypothetical protein Fmac_014062 [Flemingia macrophylla]|uniref:Uncharacterized protein n=1 Tax=Flemingia macrophylla TaxID=520843 RepID=A0ABD1MAQ3_9FABA